MSIYISKICKLHPITFSLLLIFGSSFLNSCKKSTPNYYVSQGLKDWVFFRPGSQWIYKNDSTGNKETVIANKTKEIMSGGKDIARYDEEINIYFSSSFLNAFYLGFQCNPSYTTDHTSGHTDKLVISLLYNNAELTFLALWPDEPLNEELPTPCLGATRTIKSEIINNYIVDTNHFSSVLHTTLTEDSKYNYEFYFAKHIGLVHFSENNTEFKLYRSYSLVSWNVKQ